VIETLLSIAAVAFGFGLIIFVHELGHFLVAKWAGVRVERFSLGFGPRLVGFTRGDTEYRLSIVPLGGYVKLSGEQSSRDKTPEPHDLVAKPPGVRAAIFAAGSVVNFFFTLPLLCCMYLVGIEAAGPVVGYVRDPGAAAQAGLRVGDRVLAADGRAVAVWEDIENAFKARPGETVALRVRRAGGGEAALSVPATADGRPSFLAANRRAVGLVPEGTPAAAAGLAPGDVILAVNGRAFDDDGAAGERYAAFSEVWTLPAEKPVTLRVARGSGEKTLTVQAPDTKEALVLGMRIHMPAVLGEIQEGSPAEAAGLEAGDRVLTADGVRVRSWEHMVQMIRTSDGAVAVEIERQAGAAPRPVTVTPVGAFVGLGPKQIGAKGAPPVVYAVEPGTPAAEAGIRPGDALVAVAGKKPVADAGIHRVLAAYPDVEVKVELLRDGEPIEKTLRSVKRTHASLGVPFGLAYVERVSYRLGFFGAARRAGSHFVGLCGQTAILLKGLFSGGISPEHINGPTGIVAVSYKQAREGIGNLLSFLALISLNLSIVNMFPIPILDGGHILLLGVEKVLRRPLSERTVTVAQYVGLVVLLLVVVLATTNDIGLIGRLFGG
jgi:regulator of sigma E protease